MRRRDHGFTMIELMVVVAILGISAAVVISGFKRHRTGEDARKIAALMATAYRTAVGTGPVRTDVKLADGDADKNEHSARTYISFENTAKQSTVTVWLKVEDDSPSTGYTWKPVQVALLDQNTTIFKVADTANVDLATATVTAGGTPAAKYYYPDATAQPFTVYLQDQNDSSATKYRIVGMPLSPVPQVFQDW